MSKVNRPARIGPVRTGAASRPRQIPATTLTPPITIIEKARDGVRLQDSEVKNFIENYKKGRVAEAQLGALIMALRLNGQPVPTIPGKDLAFKSDAVRSASQKIPLSRQEIFSFIDGCVKGTVPEYEIGAWLMAVRLNGLTDNETAFLSEAMWKTGGEIDLSSIAGRKGDKHAAGGSSDNTSFLIAPLLACFGVAVPMMSGRMLAHTGGTLDKLESIPGFDVALDEAAVIRTLQGPGLAIFGQMPTIAPADGILYALRQLTGTVQSVPLIAASIISKKLAEGADCLALVGTFGSGAFARDVDEAEALSRLMRNAAIKAGRSVACFMVDMSQPLTPFVGPALEMKMAIRALKDQPDPRLDRLKELSIEIAAHILLMAGVYSTKDIAYARVALLGKLRNGEALEKFRQMIAAQGGEDVIGDPKSFADSPLFKQAPVRFEVRANRSGFVYAISADEIGNAVNDLGAGRTEQRPIIDHGVGAADLALVGDRIEKNGLLAVVYANDLESARAAGARIIQAYSIGDERLDPPKLISKIIL